MQMRSSETEKTERGDKDSRRAHKEIKQMCFIHYKLAIDTVGHDLGTTIRLIMTWE